VAGFKNRIKAPADNEHLLRVVVEITEMSLSSLFACVRKRHQIRIPADCTTDEQWLVRPRWGRRSAVTARRSSNRDCFTATKKSPSRG